MTTPSAAQMKEGTMNTVKLLSKAEGLATLQRPRYRPGLLLEDEDLTAGVDYTRELTRLLFGSLFGCGVICGLDVTAILKCKGRIIHVEVGTGIALDGSGNPLHVTKSTPVSYDSECGEMPPWVWVVLCYHEKDCRPKDVSCAGDGDSREYTRSRDGFVIKLYNAPPDCACSCAETEPGIPTRPKNRCCQDTAEQMTAAEESRLAAILAERNTPDAKAILETYRAGSQRSTAVTTKKVEGDLVCACYAEHNAGTCVPDCGCSCVVLARIETKAPDDKKDDDVTLHPDQTVRRWIRPLLTGFLPCLELAKPPATPEPQKPLAVRCEFEKSAINPGETVRVRSVVSGGAPGAVRTYGWSASPSPGTIKGNGSDVIFDSTGLEGPSEATITVRVFDDKGGAAESKCTVKINRVEIG